VARQRGIGRCVTELITRLHEIGVSFTAPIDADLQRASFNKGATTDFGIAWPPEKFKLEASGTAPHGYTVTNPYPFSSHPSTTVPFKVTAVTPDDAPPDLPVTLTQVVPVPLTSVPTAPLRRVSSSVRGAA
jgi:hypothetical protein